MYVKSGDWTSLSCKFIKDCHSCLACNLHEQVGRLESQPTHTNRKRTSLEFRCDSHQNKKMEEGRP